MFNFQDIQKNRGMTYVELIVVLSIASLLASVSIFNYQVFQSKVDMKNLANDIALKITEAQKSSVSGRLPSSGVTSTWRPSYGISFLQISPTTNKVFYLFTDKNQDKTISSSDLASCPSGECTEFVNLNKGNYISSIKSYVGSTPTIINNPLHITYTRPNSGAVFYLNSSPLVADYIEINLSDAAGSTTGKIEVHASGRVSIN